ncbi:MAG: DUF3944 domain-containing protein [Psittacicella sp.]
MSNYIFDNDLEFLANIASEDLDQLVDLLTKNISGKAKFFQQLTSSPRFKSHYPDHHKYWQEIALEIQKRGGNSLANIYRGGKGILYKQIVEYAYLKLKYLEKQKPSKKIESLFNSLKPIQLSHLDQVDIKELENKLIHYIIESNINSINNEQLKSILNQVGAQNIQELKLLLPKLAVGGVATFILGPIGLIASGIWVISNPLLKSIMPIIIEVASLREKYESKLLENIPIKNQNITLENKDGNENL